MTGWQELIQGNGSLKTLRCCKGNDIMCSNLIQVKSTLIRKLTPQQHCLLDPGRDSKRDNVLGKILLKRHQNQFLPYSEVFGYIQIITEAVTGHSIPSSRDLSNVGTRTGMVSGATQSDPSFDSYIDKKLCEGYKKTLEQPSWCQMFLYYSQTWMVLVGDLPLETSKG